MEQDLFLSVDGGGSKTIACLADMKGHVLAIGHADGSNALTAGKKQAADAVVEAIQKATSCIDVNRISLCRLFIPGFSQCLPLSLPFEVQLLGDSPNAYFGALGAPNGIALLAGTGSFAVSYDENRKETTVGGWGPLLGDEGSGYDIARRAIQTTLRNHDRGVPTTPLGQAVLAHYGIEEASALVHTIYHHGCDRKFMAHLCPVVGEHAKRGESDAIRIIDDAAHALCAMAVTLQQRAHLGSCKAALTGGVSGLGDIIKRPLSQYLIQENIHLHEPLYPPMIGGVLYTWCSLTGAMPDATLAANYHATYKQKEIEPPC